MNPESSDKKTPDRFVDPGLNYIQPPRTNCYSPWRGNPDSACQPPAIARAALLAAAAALSYLIFICGTFLMNES